jgi:hypothetical protein
VRFDCRCRVVALALVALLVALTGCADSGSENKRSPSPQSSAPQLTSEGFAGPPSADAVALAQKYLDIAARLGLPLIFDADALARIKGSSGNAAFCGTLYPELILPLVRSGPGDAPLILAEASVYCPNNVDGLVALIQSSGVVSSEDIANALTVIRN